MHWFEVGMKAYILSYEPALASAPPLADATIIAGQKKWGIGARQRNGPEISSPRARDAASATRLVAGLSRRSGARRHEPLRAAQGCGSQ
jgi:hypothetical protein